MQITKSTIEKDGSCNYCDKGKLSLGGTNLNYPYKDVIVVKGTYVKSNFCEECFSKLLDFNNQ